MVREFCPLVWLNAQRVALEHAHADWWPGHDLLPVSVRNLMTARELQGCVVPGIVKKHLLNLHPHPQQSAMPCHAMPFLVLIGEQAVCRRGCNKGSEGASR